MPLLEIVAYSYASALAAQLATLRATVDCLEGSLARAPPPLRLADVEQGLQVVRVVAVRKVEPRDVHACLHQLHQLRP